MNAVTCLANIYPTPRLEVLFASHWLNLIFIFGIGIFVWYQCQVLCFESLVSRGSNVHLKKTMPNTSSSSKNPRDGASALSIMFFWWMNDVLKLGNKRPLTDQDLFPLLEGHKAEVLIEKAEKCWLEELKGAQSKNKKPRLWKAVARIIPWKSGLAMLTLQTIRPLSYAFLPVCLWLLLKTLNDGPNLDMKFAFIYVALLGITSMVQAVTSQHFNYLADQWGLKVKVAIIGLVYKKVNLYYKSDLYSPLEELGLILAKGCCCPFFLLELTSPSPFNFPQSFMGGNLTSEFQSQIQFSIEKNRVMKGAMCPK